MKSIKDRDREGLLGQMLSGADYVGIARMDDCKAWILDWVCGLL